MGLTHTPRVIASIARGLLRRRGTTEKAILEGSGIGPQHPHLYQARAGLLDVDYLGHLNNAAYLSHAELARWELTAYNGLMSHMYHDKVAYLVSSSAIRYRREVRPIFRKFQIDTFVSAFSEKHIWFSQNFRYPIPGQNRVRAQMIMKGVAVQNRKVLDPRVYFKTLGYDAELIDQLSIPNADESDLTDRMFEQFDAFEESLKEVATLDDEAHEEVL
jgi:acyl-CoA thioesterase FadM